MVRDHPSVRGWQWTHRARHRGHGARPLGEKPCSASTACRRKFERNAKDYYAILEATQKGALDITDWLDWFLDCLDRAIGEAKTTLASILAKARFWEVHAGASFNDRQRLMLNRLLDGFDGKLTSSKWATITKSSQDTASRDIDDLVLRGILKKDAAGGRSTSYSLVEPA